MQNESAQNIWDLDRPESIRNQAIQRILNTIVDGHIDEGKPLPSENVLAKQMGISRVALREAIKQLEVLGFLKIERGNGTMVTNPDFNCIGMIIEFLGRTSRITLKDLHGFRTIIETEAVAMIASTGDNKLVKKLEEILKKSEENIDKELGYVDLDFRFHREILSACPNKLLPMILAPFDNYLKKSRKLSFTGIAGARKTIETHRKIVEAILKRDPQEARKVMQKHLQKTARDLKLSEQGK